MLKAILYIRILNFRNVKNHYKCYVAPGVGTQAANCEAPERTSPSSWRIHVLSRENINLVPVETFSWNKTSQFDDLGQVKTFSWYKTPFTASLVMSIDMNVNMGPAAVGTRSLRCCAICSPGIRRRPSTKWWHHTKCHIQPWTWESVQAQDYRLTIQYYDYMSDNLTDGFVYLSYVKY